MSKHQKSPKNCQNIQICSKSKNVLNTKKPQNTKKPKYLKNAQNTKNSQNSKTPKMPKIPPKKQHKNDPKCQKKLSKHTHTKKMIKATKYAKYLEIQKP